MVRLERAYPPNPQADSFPLGQDFDHLDPGEKESSSDSEVIISCTSRNVHDLRPKVKPIPNESIKSHEINIHQAETLSESEVSFIPKPHLIIRDGTLILKPAPNTRIDPSNKSNEQLT